MTSCLLYWTPIPSEKGEIYSKRNFLPGSLDSFHDISGCSSLSIAPDKRG